MPLDRQRYSEDWEAVSKAKRDAAKCCEWCGAPNLTEIVRIDGTGIYGVPTLDDAPGVEELVDSIERWVDEQGEEVDPPKVVCSDFIDTEDWNIRCTKVVLTVAHLDQDPTNNDPENLAALCQRCHLTYDSRPEQRTRRYQITLEQVGGQRRLF